MKDLLYPLRVMHGNLYEWKKNKLPLIEERFRNPKAVYLVFTPEHDNLGDHAIAQSETEWLKALGIQYIEVTGKTLEKWRRYNALNIMNGRSILIHGGGYLGTIWPESEALLRAIISNNPRSEILLLPNTVFYEEDDTGRREMEGSSVLYNRHEHLKLYAREKTSYETMKLLYRDVAIAPDMVLRMNKCIPGIRRNGCILCLRSDREKTRSEQTDTIIEAQVRELFGDRIRRIDMIVSRQIPIEDRDLELEQQFDAFRHAELVITDRLHGMIFCAITGTPCVVLNSKSPKVLGCYAWIKDLPYIRFCDDAVKIKQIYQDIPKREWYYEPEKLLPYYEDLKYDLLRISRGKRYADRQCNRSGI